MNSFTAGGVPQWAWVTGGCLFAVCLIAGYLVGVWQTERRLLRQVRKRPACRTCNRHHPPGSDCVQQITNCEVRFEVHHEEFTGAVAQAEKELRALGS